MRTMLLLTLAIASTVAQAQTTPNPILASGVKGRLLVSIDCILLHH